MDNETELEKARQAMEEAFVKARSIQNEFIEDNMRYDAGFRDGKIAQVIAAMHQAAHNALVVTDESGTVGTNEKETVGTDEEEAGSGG